MPALDVRQAAAEAFGKPRGIRIVADPAAVAQDNGVDRTEGRGGLDDELQLIADGLGLAPHEPQGAGSEASGVAAPQPTDADRDDDNADTQPADDPKPAPAEPPTSAENEGKP